MTTHSQLVDELVAETHRRDMRTTIGKYVNQTIRELHFDDKTGNAITYGANFFEAEVTADSNGGVTLWEFPRPHLFQVLTAVEYTAVPGVLPRPRHPQAGIAFADRVDGEFYFYRTGDSYAFFGAPASSTIRLGWYELPPRLKYYKVESRPAQWDDEDGWTYNDDVPGTEDDKLAARAKVTHWIFQRYREIVEQGARAKVYARLADTERARLAYSLYQSLRPGLISAESHNYVPIYTK